MSDEESNKGRQSKEERAAMKNAARSQRSTKARSLLANLINDQHKIDIEPSKITSTKYVRELGLKFVPSDEQTFPWPYISTSQISSQDLAMLESAVTNGKVTAVKDDMYNAAAAFRSRSSHSVSRPGLSPTHSFSFPHHHDHHQQQQTPQHESYRPPPPSLPPLQTSQVPQSPHSHSRLNSLAEASSAQASATSAHPSTSHGHHWAGAAAQASTSTTHINSPAPDSHGNNTQQQQKVVVNEARSTAGFTPANSNNNGNGNGSNNNSNSNNGSSNNNNNPNPRKRPYPFESYESRTEEESHFRIKIPRTCLKDVLESETSSQTSRIRDLESRLSDLERDIEMQNKELHKLRNENERLRKDLSQQGGDELDRLRAENEHLKALGRKLFD